MAICSLGLLHAVCNFQLKAIICSENIIHRQIKEFSQKNILFLIVVFLKKFRRKLFHPFIDMIIGSNNNLHCGRHIFNVAVFISNVC